MKVEFGLNAIRASRTKYKHDETHPSASPESKLVEESYREHT